MQTNNINFKEQWYNKPLDKPKQTSRILSILKSEEGATIVKNKTERNKKINFLKNFIEETDV
jgi:hypothetical protein